MRIGIIGAGINGSYLAWKLSEQHDVFLFDQKEIVGKEACSGLISNRIWNFIPRDNSLIKNAIESVCMHFPKKDVETYLNPLMYVIDRVKLDRYVFNLAKENGANIYMKHRLVKLFCFRKKKPQIVVNYKGETIVHEFDYIIGSDGANSVVRSQISKKIPKMKLGIKTYVKKKDKESFVDVWPTLNGFFWKIPRGNDIEYGIFENPDTSKKLYDLFMKKFRLKGEGIYSSVIPCGLVTGRDNVALCGDAAGLTKPHSGGGVIWGLYAADRLAKDFPNLRKYNLWLERFYEPRFLFIGAASKLATFFGRHFPFLVPKKSYIDSDWVF